MIIIIINSYMLSNTLSEGKENFYFWIYNPNKDAVKSGKYC